MLSFRCVPLSPDLPKLYSCILRGRPSQHRSDIDQRWSDRALCVLPLYHINGEMVTVMGPLVSGGSVVMPRRFSASLMWQWVRDHACTWMSVVPTITATMIVSGCSPTLSPMIFGEMNSPSIACTAANQTRMRIGLSQPSSGTN